MYTKNLHTSVKMYLFKDDYRDDDDATTGIFEDLSAA